MPRSGSSEPWWRHRIHSRDATLVERAAETLRRRGAVKLRTLEARASSRRRAFGRVFRLPSIHMFMLKCSSSFFL